MAGSRRKDWSNLYASPVDKAKLLVALKERCVHCGNPAADYTIMGWPAIAQALVRFGLDEKPVGDATLRKRVKHAGLPVWRGVNSRRNGSTMNGPWRIPRTTNLVLLAWVASQGRILVHPPWHPFRVEVMGVPQPVRLPRRRQQSRMAPRDAGPPGVTVLGTS
jgi:hypothetical protein